MKVENLRSLIREGIAEWVKEMDMAAEAASHKARITSLEEAIATRETKLNNMTEGEHADYLDQAKIKELQNEIKELKKHKAKFEKAAEKQAAKHAKKSAPKEEDVVTDTEIEEAPISTEDVMAEMNVDDENTINESFLKMQKLAGVITETQYNKLLSEAIKTTTNSPEVNELFGFGGGTKFKDGAIVYIKKGNRSSEEFETVPRKINFGINKPQKIQGKFSYFVTAPKQTDGNFYNSGGLWVAEENIKLA